MSLIELSISIRAKSLGLDHDDELIGGKDSQSRQHD